MKQEIEKEAREFVNRTTIYGAEKATIGSGARSYFETELRCFIAGVNSKCAERIKIEYSDQECVSFADWKDKIDWNNYVEGIAQVVHKEIEHDGHIMTVRKSNSELLTIYKKENE